METSNMKNMVVLKNLPSNLVEEAIVILKSSKKIKKLEKIDKNRKIEQTEFAKKEKDYVLKEAEMLVSTYLSKLENHHEKKQYKTIKDTRKYTRLKTYAYLSSMIVIIESLLLLIQ